MFKKSFLQNKGFTLIEILVAVAIIGILSSVGLYAYDSAQAKGRDSRRKQDLRAIDLALELYRQKNNGAYPAAGGTGWLYSFNTSPWFSSLTTDYINQVPVDPVNSGAGAGQGCNFGGDNKFDNPNCYTYGYYRGGNLSTTNNGYILVTRLENKNDPEAGYAKKAGSSSPTCWPTPAVGTNPCGRETTIYKDLFILGNP